MTIFDEIDSVNKKLNKIKEKIWFLQIEAESPRTSIISDMPKGSGGTSNLLENYIIKKEKYVAKRDTLELRLDNLWQRAFHQMSEVGVDEQVQKMMYLRFGRCLQWEKCANELVKLYPESKWNVNKCFRKYRDVLYRLRKLNRS